jgi:hypothetical protein
MHKSVTAIKRVSKKDLKRAMRPLRKLGIYYRGRKTFFDNQVDLLRSYLLDPEADSGVRVPIRKFLKRMGASTTTPRIAKYECSTLGTIYTPCENRACMFWGDFASHLNCAAYYMKTQGRNTLTVAEMGIFSGYSRSRINDILASGMAKLRRSALKTMGAELFGAEATEDTKFEEGKCCLCNAPTTLPPGYFSTDGDPEAFQYCSFECWTKKYPLEAFVEKSTGGMPRDVFAHLPRTYNSLEEAAKCLTVSSEKLESVLWARQPENSLLRDRVQPILSVRERGRKFWEKQGEKWKALAAP